MSTKVCVTSVRPEWSDAVTIRQLQDMIAALYNLGHDADTPVTYLSDRDHVWLETIDDDDVVIVLEPEPRVWQAPVTPPPGVVVEDSYGTRWKWENGLRYAYYGGEWDSGIEAAVDGWFPRHISTLTEVLS